MHETYAVRVWLEFCISAVPLTQWYSLSGRPQECLLDRQSCKHPKPSIINSGMWFGLQSKSSMAHDAYAVMQVES